VFFPQPPLQHDESVLGFFSRLPNEVIGLVFKHIDSAKDVCSLSSCARLFYILGSDQMLWGNLCAKHIDMSANKNFKASGKNWTWLYKSKVELKMNDGVGMKKIAGRGMLQGEWVNGQLEGYPAPLACSLAAGLAWPDLRFFSSYGIQIVKREDESEEWSWGVYEGMWANGMRHGKGNWYGDDGSLFEGTWKEV